MQFIQNGPDIPEALLQAHEEGRVVFFCGAGISYPAGLPGFKGLVDKIYHAAGTQRNAIEDRAYQRGQYDAALDLLEKRLPGQRSAVRTALMQVLKPKLRLKGATLTHEALLQLARSRSGVVRLVTTNFDRIFQHLIKKSKLVTPEYPAPLLPVPKNSRWNGVVYLHGLLPEKSDENALNRLVLTSGDFGLAYLTERWAARFAGELFRNYVVCFVGYSINDPVLRYMMDALAADRILGEVTPQAYAFGECRRGQETAETENWEAKGVKPILYEVPAGTHDHSALHRTLKAWAETYRDGVQGKERIVVDYAMTRPSASTKQDDFVGRMLWALSDDSGLPARRFAELDPVPSLDWLKALNEDRYRHGDLPRFDIQAGSRPNDKLAFSLMHRPAPYHRAPWMSLVSQGRGAGQWDKVMDQIARWLMRHLDDPELVLWLAEHGGKPDSQFIWLIDNQLDNLARLEREGNMAELDRIRANAPNAIPQPQMRMLWRLLLTGRIKAPWRDLDLYRWQDRLQRDGITATLRLELRELLAPKVKLKRPFSWNGDEAEISEPKRFKQRVDWELELATDNVSSGFADHGQSDSWKAGLPAMIDDFRQLLSDALDLLRELGEAEDRNDPAYWHLPSICPHPQNRRFHDWVALIELLRDAWLAIHRDDVTRARYIVLDWLAQPYPTFRRLALFAATCDGVAPHGEWVDWLLANEGWWLWSVQTQRETMRLLVLRGAQLPDIQKVRLEAAILDGPPREMFRLDMTPERWENRVNHTVWLRLAKFTSGGAHLGRDAEIRLAGLLADHPTLALASNEKDEFSHWMSGTGDADFEDQRIVDRAPRTRHDLAVWLKREPAKGFFDEDNWRETCRERFFVSACALCDLARDNCWPAERWREALQTWSDDKFVQRAWRFLAPLLRDMTETLLVELAHSLSSWLRAAAKVLDRHDDVFLELCRRILALPDQGGVDAGDAVMQAINHPVGHVAQALLDFWFRRDPNDNDGLPADLEPLLTQLCDTSVDRYRHGRIVMASRLIALFRVDRAWTEAHLLHLFNWSRPAEAQSLWQGFLWSPRLYSPLLAAFKTDFLETARHYAELGEHADQYATLLTYAALDSEGVFAPRELYDTFNVLPGEGLQASAQALVRALEGAGEQRESFWTNRIQPFWQKVWPKSRSRASVVIAGQLARLVVAAGGEFPAALNAVQAWLRSLESPDYVVRRLHQSGLCARFPQEALQLMAAIIDDQSFAPTHLGDCLNTVVQAWPGALHEPSYQRLTEYLRKRSGP